MSRSAKFDSAQIIDVTSRVIARDGPALATMARIASEAGAPTGSIYHRFSSRDVLLGEVWLAAAEGFQTAFGEKLRGRDPWRAGLDAALMVAERARTHTAEARILLLHRRDDFLRGRWPEPLALRADALKRQLETGMRDFCQRLLGAVDPPALRALRFAIVDIPMAAVLPHLRAQEDLPLSIESLIRVGYEAVIAHAGKSPAKANR